jgi:hypothetical protein
VEPLRWEELGRPLRWEELGRTLRREELGRPLRQEELGRTLLTLHDEGKIQGQAEFHVIFYVLKRLWAFGGESLFHIVP